jgi:hypothetical protein
MRWWRNALPSARGSAKFSSAALSAVIRYPGVQLVVRIVTAAPVIVPSVF